MKTTRIKIDGMTCLNCVTHVQKALEAVPTVKRVDMALGEEAAIQHEAASDDQLLRAVRAAGNYRGQIVQ
jgi:copper chaperone CopZ